MTRIIQLIISCLLIYAAMLLFSAEGRAEDLHFIYPADKSVVSASPIRIIGQSDNNRTLSVSVENRSGTKKYAVSSHNNYFSQVVHLSLGKNTITLLSPSGTSDTIDLILADNDLSSPYPENFSPYYLHSKNDLIGKCELCHPMDTKKTIQYKYVDQKLSCITDSCHANFDQAAFLHGPFEEGLCVKCHNPHGTENNNFVKYFGSALCFECHTEAERMVQDAEYVHFPVLKGECTACHDPHKSNLEYHLKRETMVGLCSGCHGDVITNQKTLHEPVEAGDCNPCHLPHVSENKGLLIESGKDLCFRCHEVRKEEFESAYTHEPALKGCTSCHDPHGSATIKQLRNRKDENGNYTSVTQPIRELCLDCHRKLDPEVVDQIENATVQHDPVFKGQCVTCHTPHSTNYKKQLRGSLSEICYSCHPKMKELITSSMYKHGPVRTNECAQCHLVHGSSLKYLLRNTFSTKFAEEFNIENFTLCFNCHNPEIVLDRETEVTNFRNGTNNLHYFHVNRKKNGRNCKTCHDVHASNQENHIREEIPFNRRFSIKIEYTKTETGGGCVVGCHKPRKYDRLHPEVNR